MQLVAHAPESPHDVTTTIYVRRYALGDGERFGVHAHDEHQLSWSPDSVVEAEIGPRHWALPPTLALWTPGGLEHDVGLTRSGSLYNLYVAPTRCALGWAERASVVAVSALLRELMTHLSELSDCSPVRRRAERVVLDLLEPATEAPLSVPRPRDLRAAAIADGLFDNPADDRTLDEWGELVGASRRTLARLFVAETGLTFADWRTQVRLRAAVLQLSQGEAAAVVARRVGYRSPSALSSVFQRHLGRSPRTYIGDS